MFCFGSADILPKCCFLNRGAEAAESVWTAVVSGVDFKKFNTPNQSQGCRVATTYVPQFSLKESGAGFSKFWFSGFVSAVSSARTLLTADICRPGQR